MFKGFIDPGTEVQAEFALDHDATGTASLFLAFGSAAEGGGGDSDAATVAPGGSATVGITAGEQGMIRVLVDVSEESDTGELEVRPPTPAERVEGDTTWTYGVTG